MGAPHCVHDTRVVSRCAVTHDPGTRVAVAGCCASTTTTWDRAPRRIRYGDELEYPQRLARLNAAIAGEPDAVGKEGAEPGTQDARKYPSDHAEAQLKTWARIASTRTVHMCAASLKVAPQGDCRADAVTRKGARLAEAKGRHSCHPGRLVQQPSARDRTTAVAVGIQRGVERVVDGGLREPRAATSCRGRSRRARRCWFSRCCRATPSWPI